MGRSPDATVNGMPPKLTFAFACLHTGDQTDDWLVRVRFSSSKEGAESANRSVSFVLQLHGIFNPQPNPQKAMSCTTCAVFGSPRVLVSCCKTSPRCAVTAEVASSSLVVPAISFQSDTRQLRGVCGESRSRCVSFCVSFRSLTSTFNFPSCIDQVRFVDDVVVTAKDLHGFVSRYLHGDTLRDATPCQIANGTSAEVVQIQADVSLVVLAIRSLGRNIFAKP
jgi:hypothetical protein